MKKALVLGAGGFIGSHMVKRLKNDGYFVRGVDLKYPEFSETKADEFFIYDLRNPNNVAISLDTSGGFDLVIQLAADMGGAGYIFTGDNDANVMHNSAMINLNVCFWASKFNAKKVFYSSSACIYPNYKQTQTDVSLKESDSEPAEPDSCYGWEKLFSEKMYDAFYRNYGLDISVARFHNIFGEEGTYNGGKEKAPAAICRKVAAAQDGGEIEIWGDGEATRSFLYIDECIEGVLRLIESGCKFPLNIGSDEMVTINQLTQMVIDISGKTLSVKHNTSMPQGVRGRNSNNDLISDTLGWRPTSKLKDGMVKLYHWVNKQVNG